MFQSLRPITPFPMTSDRRRPELSACHLYIGLPVPTELTFPSVLTKQFGVVTGMVDKWHHLVLLSLNVLSYSNRILYSPGEVSVN